MQKMQNCWEFKKCGREPGGAIAEQLGICPTTVAEFANGLNGGINGGRICWAINWKSVDDKVACMNCDFFCLLEGEEHSLSAKR